MGASIAGLQSLHTMHVAFTFAESQFSLRPFTLGRQYVDVIAADEILEIYSPPADDAAWLGLMHT